MQQWRGLLGDNCVVGDWTLILVVSLPCRPTTGEGIESNCLLLGDDEFLLLSGIGR